MSLTRCARRTQAQSQWKRISKILARRQLCRPCVASPHTWLQTVIMHRRHRVFRRFNSRGLFCPRQSPSTPWLPSALSTIMLCRLPGSCNKTLQVSAAHHLLHDTGLPFAYPSWQFAPPSLCMCSESGKSGHTGWLRSSTKAASRRGASPLAHCRTLFRDVGSFPWHVSCSPSVQHRTDLPCMCAVPCSDTLGPPHRRFSWPLVCHEERRRRRVPCCHPRTDAICRSRRVRARCQNAGVLSFP